ncbi:hypothetical protein DSLASN_10060 [Desulfoluna limicola]|uniref:Uncharacterized protein n=1 Tax=Desulfoluna limicola TaxID=2810562 RepID=A0ABN6EYJ8_9BACT|nr:hypothetical protein DSLASN_10060 [Desulfoluna limicola]
MHDKRKNQGALRKYPTTLFCRNNARSEGDKCSQPFFLGLIIFVQPEGRFVFFVVYALTGS